jgi:hypothetical protein
MWKFSSISRSNSKFYPYDFGHTCENFHLNHNEKNCHFHPYAMMSSMWQVSFTWINSHKFHYSTMCDQNFACYQFHLEHLMQVIHLNQFVKYFSHIFNIDMAQFHTCMKFICMICSMRSSISCSSMWFISIVLNASTTSLFLCNLSMS